MEEQEAKEDEEEEMRRKRGQAVREGVEKEIITFNTSF